VNSPRVGSRCARTVLGALVVALSGCAGQAEPPKPSLELAWISKGRCNSFFDIGRFGARLAGQDLAALGEASVTVELMEPDDCAAAQAAPASMEPCANAAAQMVKVEEAIAANVDAIAISVSDPACLTPLLDRAVDQGTKVLTFDADAPASRRHVYYGMDNRAAGRLVAGALGDLLGGSGKLAIQTSMIRDAAGEYHLSTSSSYVERMAGIEEGLAEYPDLTLVDTLPCIGNDVLDPTCAAEVEALLAEEPEIQGLVLSRGKVLREVDLAEHAPELTSAVKSGKLRVVGFDAPDDSLDNIVAGYADVVIAQKQFGWGYDVMTLAYDMLINGAELPAFYDSGWYLVCQNNVDQYRSMWEAHDFRGELASCAALD
jgi:ribose transport system substrate-binding protein